MKAKLIAGNWILSFVALCIDPELSPLWAVVLIYGWFAGSSVLLNYADKRGWMDAIRN